jgi:hypothetical protein
VLGAVALGAIVVAAISFGIVDVSIADANHCVGGASACADRVVPTIALLFAALGGLALLVSIIPTVQWIIDAVHAGRTSHFDAQVDEAVLARRRTRTLVDDRRS